MADHRKWNEYWNGPNHYRAGRYKNGNLEDIDATEDTEGVKQSNEYVEFIYRV